MINSANRNPYEVSVETVRGIFGQHLAGRPGGLVGVISSEALGAAAVSALESSAAALGFGEGSCCYVTLRAGEGDQQTQLGANDLRMAIEGTDPLVLVATDAQVANLLSHAYQCEVPTNARSRVLGRTCVAFKAFEGLLATPGDKQKAWALLKQLK